MKRRNRVLSVFLVMALVVTTVFSAGTAVNAATKKKSKVLIAYFGRYGNTNFKKDVDATTSASIVKDGRKKRGTTEMLARLIQKETGGDLFCIQTKEKYPASYNKVIDHSVLYTWKFRAERYLSADTEIMFRLRYSVRLFSRGR